MMSLAVPAAARLTLVHRPLRAADQCHGSSEGLLKHQRRARAGVRVRAVSAGFCACRQPRQLVFERPHRKQARSSAALVRRRPDGPLPSSFLAFTLFFCILLARSVRTCRASILQSKVLGLWFVRLLEDKRL